jgi:serine/threonine-protein kinase
LTNNQLYPIYITLGYIKREEGNYKEAINEFNQALKINPEYFRASLEKANTYFFYLNQTKNAEDEYKNSIKLRGNYWEGFRWLAYLYYVTGRYPEAESNLLKVINLNPAYLWTYSTLIAIYNKRGDKESVIKARDIFDRAKKFEPNCSIYSNMGTNLYFQKKYLEATEMYKKTVDLGKNNPDLFIFWANLADGYRLSEQHDDKAKEAYKKAIKLVRKRMSEKQYAALEAYFHSCLALYLAKLGDFKQAIVEINKALKLDPNHLEVLQNSIIVYELVGQRERALVHLEEYHKRQGAMGMLSRNPFLSELHKDPQFKSRWGEPIEITKSKKREKSQ